MIPAPVRLSSVEASELRRASRGGTQPAAANTAEGRAWWRLVALEYVRPRTREDADGREVPDGWTVTAAGTARIAALDARPWGDVVHEQKWPRDAAATRHGA